MPVPKIFVYPIPFALALGGVWLAGLNITPSHNNKKVSEFPLGVVRTDPDTGEMHIRYVNPDGTPKQAPHNLRYTLVKKLSGSTPYDDDGFDAGDIHIKKPWEETRG